MKEWGNSTDACKQILVHLFSQTQSSRRAATSRDSSRNRTSGIEGVAGLAQQTQEVLLADSDVKIEMGKIRKISFRYTVSEHSTTLSQ